MLLTYYTVLCCTYSTAAAAHLLYCTVLYLQYCCCCSQLLLYRGGRIVLWGGYYPGGAVVWGAIVVVDSCPRGLLSRGNCQGAIIWGAVISLGTCPRTVACSVLFTIIPRHSLSFSKLSMNTAIRAGVHNLETCLCTHRYERCHKNLELCCTSYSAVTPQVFKQGQRLFKSGAYSRKYGTNFY